MIQTQWTAVTAYCREHFLELFLTLIKTLLLLFFSVAEFIFKMGMDLCTAFKSLFERR